MSPYSCQHNGGRDRFANEVHRPHGQSVLLVVGARLGSQEDHRRPGRCRICLQAFAYLVAIHFRHHDVEENEIGPRAGGQLQSLGPAIGQFHPIVGTQQLIEQAEIGRGIVDNQYRCAVSHYCPPPPELALSRICNA